MRILDRVDLSRFRPEARGRHRAEALPAPVGQRLRDGREPTRDDLLPARAVGGGHRSRSWTAPGRSGEIIVERLEDDGELDAAGATELVQLLEAGGFLEPVPVGFEQGLAEGTRPANARSTEGPHVHEDAVDRMDGRRPIRSLVVPDVSCGHSSARPAWRSATLIAVGRLRRVPRRSRRPVTSASEHDRLPSSR